MFPFLFIFNFRVQRSNSSVEELARVVMERKGVPDIIGAYTYFFIYHILVSFWFFPFFFVLLD